MKMKFLCAAGMVGMRVTGVSSGVNGGLGCRSVAKSFLSMFKALGLILGNTHTHTHTHTHEWKINLST
jgi:hypothetical protein